jgi:hypothetical protein
MRKSSIWITILVTVVVVALLAAGGYALFRLGYVRGVADAAGGVMMRSFDGRIQPYNRGIAPGWNHPGLDIYGMHSRMYGGFSAFGWLPGLLLLVGVVALVVIAVNGLSHRNSHPASGTSLPAEPEKPASRRRTKKEE